MPLTATGEQVAWHSPGASEEEKCCCGGGCCLYPWPDPDGSPLYPDTDLPASILINGVSFAKTGSYEYNNGVDTVLTYDGSVTGAWNLFKDGFYYASECLISDIWTAVDGGTESFVVEDEFPDTLTLTVTISGETPMETYAEREPLCVWTGSSTGDYPPPGSLAQIGYGDTVLEGVGEPYKFFVLLETEGDPFIKDDPQDTPIGNYTKIGSSTTVVVS